MSRFIYDSKNSRETSTDKESWSQEIGALAGAGAGSWVRIAESEEYLQSVGVPLLPTAFSSIKNSIASKERSLLTLA